MYIPVISNYDRAHVYVVHNASSVSNSKPILQLTIQNSNYIYRQPTYLLLSTFAWNPFVRFSCPVIIFSDTNDSWLEYVSRPQTWSNMALRNRLTLSLQGAKPPPLDDIWACALGHASLSIDMYLMIIHGTPLICVYVYVSFSVQLCITNNTEKLSFQINCHQVAIG
jgi:hypothetical protein